MLDTLQYPVSTSSYQLKLQYTYAHGILQQISDFTAGTSYWLADAANPRGQITQETLGNGVVVNRAFDAVTGWISSIQAGVGGGAALQNNTYLFDEMGNLTQRQDDNRFLTENFYYDNLYRLDHSTLGGATNLQMTYDVTGNITSRSDIAGGATWTYDPNRKHAVLQAGSASNTYTYDANGNAITRNGYSIGWSSYNYPTSINGNNKNLVFYYDANHQRYEQIYTSDSALETTISVGRLLEKVIVGGVTDYRHYIRAGSELVAIMSRQSTGTNATHYMLSDHQASLNVITDSSGALTVAESFSAFGARRDPTAWSGTPSCPDLCTIKGITREGYTGQDAIGGVSMGLNHMNGRVQDAITGRFLSADPHITDPGNTQSFNRYSYVNNNPLTEIDPTGFDNKDCSTDGGCGGGSNAPGLIVPDPIDLGPTPTLNIPTAPLPTYTGSMIPGYIPGNFLCGGCVGSNGSGIGGTTGTGSTATDGGAAAGSMAAQSGGSAQSQGGTDPCAAGGCLDQVTVNSRVYPALSDGYFVDPAVWGGVSSWTSIGNIAHVALYMALLAKNPALAGRLLTNVAVNGGSGFLDLGLDGSLAYELKPDSRQYGGNYQAASNQIGGYTNGTGYIPGTWAALGTNSTWVGISGTFSAYGINYTGGFSFYYDPSNSASGLIFYQRFGNYNYDSSVPNGFTNITVAP